MKRKDLVLLLLSVVILLVAGYIGYNQLLPKKTATAAGVTVEKIGEIPAELDSNGLADLNDPTKVKDFNSPVDLTGLDNAAIFGP